MQTFASQPEESRRPPTGIEWELMPSLSHLVRPARGDTPAWADTRPAELGELLDDGEGFAEPLPGLAVQETSEPEIFRLFFGRPSIASLIDKS